MNTHVNGATTLKSFEELGGAMKSGEDHHKKFSRKPMDVCEPVHMRRLAEILGTNTKAGEALGLSATHVGKCLLDNETKITYDLAAKAVLMEMEREIARPMIYVVEVRSGQKEVFDTFLRGMNLKATQI